MYWKALFHVEVEGSFNDEGGISQIVISSSFVPMT
jgi:hypothetical protein